jgi:uncharacterized protein YndB with AHSA1/START domain
MNDDTTVRIERLVDAPIEVLFRAWTSREAMEHWYREQPDYHVHVAELDPRVGGSYRVEFGPEGGTFVEAGTYLEVDAPRRLVMTETLEGPDGPLWADTTVTIVLEQQGDKTRLVLVHEGFPTRDVRDGARGGWPGFLDRLEQYAAAN